MKQNIGRVDMIIRIIIGVVIASVGIVYESWWGLIAIVFLLTAIIKSCPLYPLFGLNTYKKTKK